MAHSLVANCCRPARTGNSRSTRSSANRTLVQSSEFLSSVNISDKWIVPYERNHYFTGRDSLLNAVRSKFSEVNKDHHRIAIYGLGGVGKTQFALEYLYRFRLQYDHCFWVRGGERTTFVFDLGLVAEKLSFTPSRKNLTPVEVASEFLRWLPQVCRWLLVIDNLDDMKVWQDLIPSGTASGHVLITTRSANLRALPTYTFEIPVLPPEEAVQLLMFRAMPDTLESDFANDELLEAREIVEDLGYLPLAIEQAAGYIQQSISGILGFRSIYQSNKQHILNRSISLDSKSVSSTWLLSFKTLQARTPTQYIC